MKIYEQALLVASIALVACTSSSTNSAPDTAAVADLATAPLRVRTRAQLDRPTDEVWAYLSNHDNLIEYSNGVLGDVKVDGTKADATGVGTMRTCTTADGTGRFVEKVVYVEPPRAFAYTVVENTWGLTNHLATVELEPTEAGGTLLTWNLYFDHVKPEMAPKVAKNIDAMMRGRMLPFLAKKFGGEVLSGTLAATR